MTDKEAEALGRRLVACDGFRWMSGMVDALGGRVVGVLEEEIHVIKSPHGSSWVTPRAMRWPDLRDPATRGSVLALVRERWPLAHVVPAAGIAPDVSSAARWRVMDGRRRDLFPWSRCATEAEALVAALEAAK